MKGFGEHAAVVSPNEWLNFETAEKSGWSEFKACLDSNNDFSPSESGIVGDHPGSQDPSVQGDITSRFR